MLVALCCERLILMGCNLSIYVVLKKSNGSCTIQHEPEINSVSIQKEPQMNETPLVKYVNQTLLLYISKNE